MISQGGELLAISFPPTDQSSRLQDPGGHREAFRGGRRENAKWQREGWGEVTLSLTYPIRRRYRLERSRWPRDFSRECLLGRGGQPEQNRGGRLSGSRMAGRNRRRPGGSVCHFLQTSENAIGRQQGCFQVGHSVRVSTNTANDLHSGSSRNISTALRWGSAPYEPQGHRLKFHPLIIGLERTVP